MRIVLWLYGLMMALVWGALGVGSALDSGPYLAIVHANRPYVADPAHGIVAPVPDPFFGTRILAFDATGRYALSETRTFDTFQVASAEVIDLWRGEIVHIIDDAPYTGRFVSLSPGATHIAYRDGASGDFVVKARESGETTFTTTMPFVEATAWSVDGREMLFVGGPGGESRLFTLDLATSVFDERFLTGPVSDVSVSADGARIAYASHVLTLRQAGRSAPLIAAPNLPDGYYQVWRAKISPDGTTIAAAIGDNGRSTDKAAQVFLLDVASGAFTRLTGFAPIASSSREVTLDNTWPFWVDGLPIPPRGYRPSDAAETR